MHDERRQVRQLNRRAWDHAVVRDLTPVWAECHRALVAGGTLISGVLNPDEFVFDDDALDNRGEFVLRHPLPYREIDSLSPEELERHIYTGQSRATDLWCRAAALSGYVPRYLRHRPRTGLGII